MLLKQVMIDAQALTTEPVAIEQSAFLLRSRMVAVSVLGPVILPDTFLQCPQFLETNAGSAP